MGKIRVYELAQRLGLENKEVLKRLRDAGIEAKSHMSVIEESDLLKLKEPSETASEEESSEAVYEERRVKPGLIRRRRKEVAPAAEPKEQEQPSAVAEEETSAPEEPAREKAPAPEETPVETPAIEAEESEAGREAAEAPAAEEASAKEAEPVTTAAEEPPTEEPTEKAQPAPAKVEEAGAQEPKAAAAEKEPKAPTGAAKEGKTEKVTASRAKILGRVELPQAGRGGNGDTRGGARRPERRRVEGGRPEANRPAGPGKPRRPVVMQQPEAAPLPVKEGRGNKRKKKGGAYGDEAARGTKGRRRVEIFDHEQTGKLRRPKKGDRKGQRTEAKSQQVLPKASKRIIRISDSITVGELAKRLGVKANDLIKELMRQGNMVTINHPLDYETAALLASEFQYEVENIAFDEEVALEHASVKSGEDKPEDMQPRPPVVTIMGHVDHGKTSLLDAIRATNVTGGEAGGITQHIGAYDVDVNDQKITFLDTPGHEAFTAMRARGAKVTDIVILVVAADDGVMPQTKEAINHAKAAGVPIVVAVNKVDKPDANPERVKQELTEFGLVPEDWGGDTIFVEVSAKERINLDQLLEMVLLQSEVLELKANPDKSAKGTIVEARLDRGRGPVATVLVQEGTMKVGDPMVAGMHYGRVRTMIDDRGQHVKEAGPSFPVEVTGLSGVPDAGDMFNTVDDEKVAKEVAQHRQQKLRELELAKSSRISLDQLYARIQEGEAVELKVIIKADVQGSVEAVSEAFTKLSTDACRLVVIHTGVGGIIESDISLAAASDAIVVGFNVRPEPKAATLAENEGVDIRLYSVIYDAVADVRDAMEGLLAPTLKEKQLGRVEVRETFHISRLGTIAGCFVLDGKVNRNSQVRLIRDNVVVWEGKLSSLKRFKDDVREVSAGYECGLGLANYNDIKVGDIIEAFEMEEVKTTL